MEIQIKQSKPVKESLEITLQPDEVESLRCVVFWSKEDNKNGSHSFATELMKLLEDFDNAVRRFQN
jgi:hypothetical protein